MHLRFHLLRILLLGGVTAWLALWVFPDAKQLKLEVELKSNAGKTGEVFYRTKTEGYSPEHGVGFEIVPDLDWRTYSVVIKVKQPIKRVRIDPGEQPGEISIRRIVLTGPHGRHELPAEALFSQAAGFNQLERSPANPGEYALKSLGNDPYFDLAVPQEIFREGAIARLYASLPWVLLGTLMGVLLEVSYAYRIRLRARFIPIWDRFGSTAAYISDERTIVFNAASVVVVLLITLLAVLFIALKLNQSSIGIWETFYPPQKIEQFIDLGSPKAVRSDEWHVQTPWILSQAQLGAPIKNKNIGAASSPLLTAVPTLHLTSLAQPKFWGFLFFDIERGYSWFWAYKVFGFFLAFFLLFLFLTGGQTLLSLTGALWIYGSSFVQWWYSSNLAEELIGFCAALLGALYLLQSRHKTGMFVGATLLLFSIPNLLLHLYPPFLVPLAYLSAAVLVGMFIQQNRVKWFVDSIRVRAAATCICLAILGVFTSKFLLDSWETIQITMSTVYPGKRVNPSGDMSLFNIFYGYFEWMRVQEDVYPLPPNNASEASSFLLLFPLIFLVTPRRIWFQNKNGLVLALTAYCVLVLLWMSVELPATIKNTLAIAGWSLTSSSRAQLGLGIASILLVIVFAANVKAGIADLRGKVRPLNIGILVFGSVALFGGILSNEDPNFFTYTRIVLGAATTAFLAFAIARRSQILLLLGVTAVIAPSVTVNPLMSGLAPILEKPILQVAKAHGSGLADKWAVIGGTVLAQGLKAHGLNVINGVEFVPDRQKMTLLDPDSKYIDIWNRYAHVAYLSEPKAVDPVFKLLGGDQYSISLNICSGILNRLGVTHIAYVGLPSASDIQCLESLPTDERSGVHLYRLR